MTFDASKPEDREQIAHGLSITITVPQIDEPLDVTDDCLYADEDAGIVIVLHRDETGQLQATPNHQPLTAVLRGSVEIRGMLSYDQAVAERAAELGI
jgi:hypothetical protein